MQRREDDGKREEMSGKEKRQVDAKSEGEFY
jgi:hypothetical protein